MTRNNLEQFNKSSPSLIFCSLWIARELLQYLVQATGRSCSTHLSWHEWWHRRELQCLSFLPQITLKRLANHIRGGWDCTHTRGVLVKPFTRRQVEKVLQPGEGKAFGRPSSTFQYQKGLRECWSGTLNRTTRGNGFKRVQA